MLAGVRNKDVGPAGNSLREMVTSLRGFTVDELDPNRKRSWWERLTGGAAPMAEFMARYEDGAGPDRQDHRRAPACTSTRC